MNKLLNGKSNISRIVGLECVDEHVEIFTQEEDGSVKSSFYPHRYWILSNRKLTANAVSLEGELHYKFGYQFTSRDDFEKARSTLRNEEIYSIYNAEEACMIKDGYTFYRDMKPSDLSILSFDIETTGLDGNARDAKVLLISTTYRDHTGKSNNVLFSYDEYKDEGEMLNAFCSYVRNVDPSVIIGHNIITYDFPYLQARADVHGVSLDLGRNNSPVKFNHYESKFRLDGTRDLLYKNISIYGREICDTYFLAVSFDVSKSFETYSLKPLIKQLGFEKEDRQHYDASTIRINYKNKNEWNKIKLYAEADAEDPIKLFDMMSPLYFNMCPFTPKPFSEILLSASGSKINGMMVRAYLQDKHSIPKADEVRSYQGALSWGKPGIYKHVFKVDCQSMYPSIIINYSVYNKEKDPNGYLLELVKIFREKRLEYKKLAAETNDSYWKQMDTTAKGYLNSFYGFYGAPGLNFNSFDCADFITSKGREILSTAIVWATSKDFKDLAPEYFEKDNLDV